MEQLVTLETGLLAKKAGFNGECRFIWEDGEPQELNYYDGDGSGVVTNSYLKEGINTEEAECILPSQAVLQKWLRERYMIHIFISPNSDNEGGDLEKWYYSYISRYDNSLHKDAFDCCCDEEFNSYEEALEEGLLQGLNLIP